MTGLTTLSPQLVPPPPRGVQALDGQGQFSVPWQSFFRSLYNVLRYGQSVTIPLAKLTTGGTNGQLVFSNGVLIGYTAPT